MLALRASQVAVNCQCRLRGRRSAKCGGGRIGFSGGGAVPCWSRISVTSFGDEGLILAWQSIRRRRRWEL
jgi:hypothetical protein